MWPSVFEADHTKETGERADGLKDAHIIGQAVVPGGVAVIPFPGLINFLLVCRTHCGEKLARKSPESRGSLQCRVPRWRAVSKRRCRRTAPVLHAFRACTADGSIQEELLFLPQIERGKDSLLERHLRPIAAVPDWCKQRRMWRELHLPKSMIA